jgi:hypothetical protein
MKKIWSALLNVYTKRRFVEEAEDRAETTLRRKATETPEQEIQRLRQTIARERTNLAAFLRFDCRALAAPLESSIRAMESRIHALELRKAI